VSDAVYAPSYVQHASDEVRVPSSVTVCALACTLSPVCVCVCVCVCVSVCICKCSHRTSYCLVCVC
jgi:hypothetical protein